MPRPCDHPTGPPRPETGCAVCRKYLTDPAYRALYDAPPAAPARPPGARPGGPPPAPAPVPLAPPPADLDPGPVAPPASDRVVVTVAVGPAGRRLLELTGPAQRRYARRVGADFHVIARPASAYPLGEKFRVGSLLRWYGRVCYLDADVLPDPAAPDLFTVVPPGRVGVHDDYPAVFGTVGVEWSRAEFALLARTQGWGPRRLGPGFVSLYNTGVVVFDRHHPQLWEPPARPYPAVHCGEQNVVNVNLREAGYAVTPLGDEFNYQWWAHRDMAGPAHFWHYAKPREVPEVARVRALAARQGVSPGPGTELARLLDRAGLGGDKGCGCGSAAARMDELGPAGCRERRAELVEGLTRRWKRLSVWARLRAAGGAVLGGLPLSAADPVGAVLDEAVRRAEGPPEDPAGPWGRRPAGGDGGGPAGLPPPAGGVTMPTRAWAYGVITVPERRGDLLPRTLRGLDRAGFPAAPLFEDGPAAPDPGGPCPPGHDRTRRTRRLGVVGNWVLALWELYVRSPGANFYALFQDDVLAPAGLREYLDRTLRPGKCYWNLYTFLDNEAEVAGARPGTWVPAAVLGAHRSPPRPDPDGRQCGAGALGLVFDRDGVQALLGHPLLVAKPAGVHLPTRSLDGAVVEAMNAAGYRELVHAPSLLGHAGRLSTVEPGKEWASAARTWPGEGWDCRTLLRDSA